MKIKVGEILSEDNSRFGKELREFRYVGEYKEILCPYWQRTDYGTVRCNFLNEEFVDDLDDNAQEKIAAHFGVSDAVERFGYSWEISDEFKICGVREDEDSVWFDEE